MAQLRVALNIRSGAFLQPRAFPWWAVLAALSVVSVLIAYCSLPHTFFQQDEWSTFARFQFAASSPNGLDLLFRPFLRISAGVQLVNVVQWQLFKLDPAGWSYVSMLAHALAVVLAGTVATRVAGRTAGLIAAVYLAVNVSSEQGVTWLTANGAVLPNAILALAAILVYVGPRVEPPGYRRIAVSATLLALSLTFRETTQAVVLMLGIVTLFWRKPGSSRWLRVVPYGLISIVHGSSAIAVFLLTNKDMPNSPYSTSLRLDSFAIDLVTTPFRALVQTIVPQKLIYRISKTALDLFYPGFEDIRETLAGNLLIEGPGANVVIIVLAILILGISIAAVWHLHRTSRPQYSQAVALGLAFCMISSTPFAILSAVGGRAGPLDSRFLYLPAAGMALALGAVAGAHIRDSHHRLRSLGAMALVLLLLGANINAVRAEVNRDVEIGSQRHGILDQISSVYPHLPDRVVFYIESDTPYYGLAQSRLPFQGGFGHILMAYFTHTGVLPASLLEGNPFWPELEQGYIEKDNRGFGYSLERWRVWQFLAHSDGRLTPSNVIAFRWQGAENKLTDLTVGFRARSQLELPLMKAAIDGRPIALLMTQGVDHEVNSQTAFLRSVAGDGDRVGSYRIGLDNAYGGSYVRYRADLDSGVLHIPTKLWGYPVQSLWGLYDAAGPILATSITRAEDGSLRVAIEEHAGRKWIDVMVALMLPVVVVSEGTGEVVEISLPQILTAIGDGISTRFVFRTDGTLASLRSLWIPEKGYTPMVEAGGQFKQIASWSGSGTRQLEVTFLEPPPHGVKINVPVLVKVDRPGLSSTLKSIVPTSLRGN